MSEPTNQTKLFCNVLAREKNLLPNGYATAFNQAIAIEMPLPWARQPFFDQNRMPSGITDLIRTIIAMPPADRISVRPLLIAPDPTYPQDGLSRVMFYRRAGELFADYARTEYLLPTEQVSDLAWALLLKPENLVSFDEFIVTGSPVRDVMICTHGSVDVACAKFGYPLYERMRSLYDDDPRVRIWRVNHFGGHVFAPTLLDMPSGRYWAYVEELDIAPIMACDSSALHIRSNYRGWAGLNDSFTQTAEAEIWGLVGGAWPGYRKVGWIVEIDPAEEPTWARVAIHYQSPDGRHSGTYTARVEVSRFVETPSNTEQSEPYAYPQYRVVSLEHSLGYAADAKNGVPTEHHL